MFQIETALLNFSEKSGTAVDDDKTSVVKRFFLFFLFLIMVLTKVNLKTLLWEDSPALNGCHGL